MLDTDEVIAAVKNDDQVGFCIECGTMQDSVEPDARRYMCEECGRLGVYGACEILLCGFSTPTKKGKK